MSNRAASFPSIGEIRTVRERLGDRIRETPVWPWRGDTIDSTVGRDKQVFAKLELFQYTGTFKARGALVNALALSEDAKRYGVTAVSAGNHAIAVAFAAREVGTSAKVVMLGTANPMRIWRCRNYGATVVLIDDAYAAFDEVERIRKQERRTFIHPFESERTILGTATVGYELCRQISDLDAVIVPIGGGGLIAGVSCAIKQVQPHCTVYGVEPDGADSMTRSFRAGSPQRLKLTNTVADSLAPPYALPYSFGIAQQFVDAIVTVSDTAIRSAMGLLFADLKLAVEPAGAAATAALCGPLREQLAGQRVAVIICGANIDLATFCKQTTPYLNPPRTHEATN